MFEYTPNKLPIKMQNRIKSHTQYISVRTQNHVNVTLYISVRIQEDNSHKLISDADVVLFQFFQVT